MKYINIPEIHHEVTYEIEFAKKGTNIEDLTWFLFSPYSAELPWHSVAVYL